MFGRLICWLRKRHDFSIIAVDGSYCWCASCRIRVPMRTATIYNIADFRPYVNVRADETCDDIPAA